MQPSSAIGGPGSLGVVIPPNQTLYVSNLNDKIKVPDLKATLYEFMSQYGEVVSVQCRKSATYRGQAFVCFADVIGASTALRSANGESFIGKPLRLSYAMKPSDVILRRLGRYVPRPKKVVEKPKDRKDEEERLAPDGTLLPADGIIMPPPSGMEDAVPAQAAASTAGTEEQSSMKKFSASLTTLCLENLPGDCPQSAVEFLVQQYPGVHEVRVVTDRNIAFVDFVQYRLAELAVEALSGFEVDKDHKLKASISKKGKI